MAEVFQKIGKPITISQEIQQKIEEAILNKTFVSGQKLPTEKEMCDMFGVSRTALREALQMLNAKGLITVKKGSGIFIKRFSRSNVLKPMMMFLELNLNKEYIAHIIEVRKVLEPGIARIAAQYRSETDIEKLEKSLIDLENCDISDYQRQGVIDRDFHLIIANATANPMIPLIIEPIFNIMPKIRMLVYANIEKAQNTALLYHTSIVNKIKNKDEDGAFDMMTEHLKLAEEHSQIISNELL